MSFSLVQAKKLILPITHRQVEPPDLKQSEIEAGVLFTASSVRR